MVRKQLLVAAAGAVLMFAAWWWFTRPTPERRVRGRLDGLARVISKREGESNSHMVLKMQQLEQLMADPVEINTDRYGMAGLHTSAELVSTAARIRGMMSHIDLDFHDVQIRQLTESDATLSCTCRFLMKSGEHGQEETAELNIKLKNIEGKWRFVDFQEVEVMKK